MAVNKLKGVLKLSDFAVLRPLEKLETDLKPFDLLTGGGLVKGGICEVFGHRGSGKRSLIISLLSNLTRKNKICVVVDCSNSFDPVSAEKSGVNLNKILWIKTFDDPQKAIISTDYLIQASMFGAIWLDLGLCSETFLEKLPGSYWFRFKVGLQDKETSLLITLEESRLRSAAHQSVKVTRESHDWSGESNFQIRTRTNSTLELVRPHKKTVGISFHEEYL